ncbi:hypothetical protein ABHF33_09785 [Chitinibacter sp. FCG-7]|uniref:DUF6916 domain-containing protein n=1 Tax=Chitinibacter mangrovi TaxID=3153927 RepID=A0AAU7F5E9_9NEIS
MAEKSAMTRRNFLICGSAATLAATGLTASRQPLHSVQALEVAPAICSSDLSPATAICPSTISLNNFASLKGQIFTVFNQDKSAKLRLTDAQSYAQPESTQATHGRRDPFSLLFVAEEGERLPDAIYTVQHAAIKHLDLFLNPVGAIQKSSKTYYQAVFG